LLLASVEIQAKKLGSVAAEDISLLLSCKGICHLDALDRNFDGLGPHDFVGPEHNPSVKTCLAH